MTEPGASPGVCAVMVMAAIAGALYLYLAVTTLIDELKREGGGDNDDG